MKTSILCAASLLALVAAACPVRADDPTYWPSEQEDRLADVSNEIVEVIRQQRQARLAKDEEKLKDLDERMKELDEEKLELLRIRGEID